MIKRFRPKFLLIFLLGIILVLGFVLLRSRSEKEEVCGGKMTLSEAKEIMAKGECAREGSLTGKSFCNDNTGTWWLDLDIQKEGCAPACVVNVLTSEAEINWRCTGLITP